jgi:hypothetical protein
MRFTSQWTCVNNMVGECQIMLEILALETIFVG